MGIFPGCLVSYRRPSCW
nr:hypothetical protein [Escherichia coli]